MGHVAPKQDLVEGGKGRNVGGFAAPAPQDAHQHVIFAGRVGDGGDFGRMAQRIDLARALQDGPRPLLSFAEQREAVKGLEGDLLGAAQARPEGRHQLRVGNHLGKGDVADVRSATLADGGLFRGHPALASEGNGALEDTIPNLVGAAAVGLRQTGVGGPNDLAIGRRPAHLVVPLIVLGAVQVEGEVPVHEGFAQMVKHGWPQAWGWGSGPPSVWVSAAGGPSGSAIGADGASAPPD
ncbi:MAG: hypothetical protein EBU46_20860 [Nitrosomonadaceae bacterium]|nr:hypothetical protein [Nitrosomonadaceae bacterium]